MQPEIVEIEQKEAKEEKEENEVPMKTRETAKIRVRSVAVG
jgi:hypothetical protein